MSDTVTLVVNGESRSLEVEGRTLLVHALRDGLGLTGAHIGCDTSQCGACTVLLDGRAVKSCTVLAPQAEGREITTIEGLSRDGEMHPLQRAFVEHHGLQCGFCTPGVILTAADLLSRDASPSDEDIRHALRDGLGLTGAHIGCDTSQCGACTVLLDGAAVKSCTLLALQADGREVTTIEGFAPDGELHPLQRAFVEHHGLQCGFCTPGIILTAADLLSRTSSPSDDEIRQALRGNLCRCTGYQAIVESIRAAGAAT